MRIFLIFLAALISSNAFGNNVLSFSPIVNSSKQIDIALPLTLRNEIVYELIRNYDCIVLSRSNGFPILEEQRYSASTSEDPEAFPYPPAADFIFVGSISDKGNQLIFTLNYTPITGTGDGQVMQSRITFRNEDELRKTGAARIIETLTTALEIKRVTRTQTYAKNTSTQVWAVLPYEIIVDSSYEDASENTLEQFIEITYAAIADSIPTAQKVDVSGMLRLQDQTFTGATERKAAEIGIHLGADFLVSGTITETQTNLIADLRAVRCNDGMVVAARRAESQSWETLKTDIHSETRRLALSLPEVSATLPADTEACMEEAKIFQGIADTLAFSSTKDPWVQYQAARTFQTAAMLAQDTPLECSILNRMHVCTISHPLIYRYLHNWKDHHLPQEAATHNDWLLREIEAMANSSACDGREAKLEVLDKSGHWDRAYAQMHEIMADQDTNFNEHDRRAADRLRITSLSGHTTEADTFFRDLDPQVRKQFTLIQAALHYRRNEQPEKEFAAMLERLEKDEWRTIDDGFARICALMEQYETPQRQLDILRQIPRKFQKDPNIQARKLRNHLALGQNEQASEIAAILLKRNDIGKGGHPTQEAFKKELKEIAGYKQAWPTAKEIQAIPPNYRMYLQPVGEYPRHILESAAEQAGEFFGCEFVVRPSIPIPTARSVYYKDMTKYVAVPLLRRFITARPPPDDAVYQVYLVDQRFLVYGRGPTTTCYRKGLGYLLSYEPYQRYIDNDNDRSEALAYGIIHGFRFFIERSQEIWIEDTPNNFPCANSRANSLKTWKRENGYCAECMRNYASADLESVYHFAQAMPDEASFSNDFMDWRHPIDEKERQSIEAYAKDNGQQPE